MTWSVNNADLDIRRGSPNVDDQGKKQSAGDTIDKAFKKYQAQKDSLNAFLKRQKLK